MLEIRLVTADDAEDYQRLRLEALETQPLAFASDAESFSKRSIEEIGAMFTKEPSEGFTLGAWLDGEFVGTVALSRPQGPKFRHDGYLVAMYVTDKVRGKGIGRQLVDELIQRARAIEGLERISLSVSTCQTSSVHLYHSAGFETWGHEKRAMKVGDTYTDFEHMAKWIAAEQ
ncbi:MAG: GNAT family N-acetyltransferase [Armatimonadetes bacterium]|nr:GNAT family N-acetyltransferase [Armatimonadota bacterium]